jgi:hypothetical protein
MLCLEGVAQVCEYGRILDIMCTQRGDWESTPSQATLDEAFFVDSQKDQPRIVYDIHVRTGLPHTHNHVDMNGSCRHSICERSPKNGPFSFPRGLDWQHLRKLQSDLVDGSQEKAKGRRLPWYAMAPFTMCTCFSRLTCSSAQLTDLACSQDPRALQKRPRRTRVVRYPSLFTPNIEHRNPTHWGRVQVPNSHLRNLSYQN